MDVFPRIAAVQGTSATTWTLLPVTAIAAVMVAHHFLQIRVCMKIVPYQQEIAWKDGNVDHEGHTQESLTVLDGERKRYDVLILARGATLTEAEGGRRAHSQGKGAESPTANNRWRCVGVQTHGKPASRSCRRRCLSFKSRKQFRVISSAT